METNNNNNINIDNIRSHSNSYLSEDKSSINNMKILNSNTNNKDNSDLSDLDMDFNNIENNDKNINEEYNEENEEEEILKKELLDIKKEIEHYESKKFKLNILLMNLKSSDNDFKAKVKGMLLMLIIEHILVIYFIISLFLYSLLFRTYELSN